LQATAFRVDQISGPVPNGCWAVTDWFPILVKSSVSMGLFPDLAGTAAWVPVTAVSDAVTDVLFHSDIPPLALNIVHPCPTKWTNIISPIRKMVIETTHDGEGDVSPLVPFSQWFAHLEASARTADKETLQNIVCIIPISQIVFQVALILVT
jgi:thioester reductase-like protein